MEKDYGIISLKQRRNPSKFPIRKAETFYILTYKPLPSYLDQKLNSLLRTHKSLRNKALHGKKSQNSIVRNIGRKKMDGGLHCPITRGRAVWFMSRQQMAILFVFLIVCLFFKTNRNPPYHQMLWIGKYFIYYKTV